MGHYILKLRKMDRDALAGVRNRSTLWAAESENFIWIKSLAEPDHILRQLPVLETYHTDEADLLFLPGALTPVGHQPALEWMTIAEFLPVEVPVAAMPARLPRSIPFRLQVATDTKPGSALLCSLSDWKQYAESAPAIRLEVLSFAVSATARVLVTGYPLPALPGEEYWSCGIGLLIPCGYEPELPIYATLFSRKLNAEGKSLVLFHTNGNYEIIENTDIVKASRSGIRLTTITHG